MFKIGLRGRTVTGVTAAALAASALAVATPGAAHATAGGYCGYYFSGYSSQPTDVWTVFVKQPPGCHDVNLTWVDHSSYYGAFYWDSAGNPHMSTTGAQWHSAYSTWDQVIMTSVNTGTRVIVVASDGGAGYGVHVDL
ncbi:hypothetical protein [Catenulispora subtropica]|uniref:Secreted protein n=1 Tax=Catenulispora subtropica TaxID=450798 RepID=A0ABN2R124_9ACTN